MTASICGAAAFLRPGGPHQVPFRPCCAATVLRAARAPESPPAPCPRLGELLSLFALTPVAVAHGSEVIP